MQQLFVSILAVMVSGAVFAQPNAIPKATLTFTIKQEDGSNGAGVAYNPKKKIYYCAMAGNASFPLEAFSNGINIYEGITGFDARGLWYNEKDNTLEGNTYNNEGIYAINLDDKGVPTGFAEYKFPTGHSDGNAVGTYDAATGTVLYFDNATGTVTRYKRTTGKLSGSPVALKKCPVAFTDLNSAMIYTGEKGYEIGVYDFVGANIYFFDKKGNYTAMSSLGSDAPYNEMFNFSYANGYVFLFDKDMKEWWGYQVF